MGVGAGCGKDVNLIIREVGRLRQPLKLPWHPRASPASEDSEDADDREDADARRGDRGRHVSRLPT